MKSVVIIGSSGQLGTDLVDVFSNNSWNVTSLNHSDIEITDINSVSKVLGNLKFDWVINTAAFHKVDECEKDSEKAWRVNAFGQKNVALVANEMNSRSVFISSDYVFNGESNKPYSVNDQISPVNAYGHSKVGGEISTLSADKGNVVMRISSVFGKAGSSGKGGNFIETILKKASAGDELSVVDDITMAPTYTKDASTLLEGALSKDYAGILHGANSGETTWHGFAKYALDKVGVECKLKASTTDWSAALKRPKYSVLDSAVTSKEIASVPDWQSAVDRYLLEKGHIS